jgi:hypothetical protein
MTLDDRIARAKDLIGKREQIDLELAALLSGSVASRKPQTCGKCGQTGHTARTCTVEALTA